MRVFKYLIIFGIIIFGFAYVNANKPHQYTYNAPRNFLQEENYFPQFYPATYNYSGPDKISVVIPPEIKSKLGVPKTKNGDLVPEFIEGKKNFNAQFGIEDWVMHDYHFTNTPHGERLEITGSYTNYIGVKTEFIQHHYFGKLKSQSIHLFYPSKSDGKIVEQAKLSLQSFKPSVN